MRHASYDRRRPGGGGRRAVASPPRGAARRRPSRRVAPLGPLTRVIVLVGCAVVVAAFAYQLRHVDWSIPFVTTEDESDGWVIALVAGVVTAVVVGAVLLAIHRRPGGRH